MRVAKQYLSYFQGTVNEWTCAEQRELRQVVPENRLRVYDVRRAIELLADQDSVLELRRDFGANMITAFIRIEGRPLGLLANNPMVLGGAIDADAADKAARFLQLCDAFDIPVLSLCDTPGNMVGPGGRTHRARAPLLSAVCRRCEHGRADFLGGAAQGLRPRFASMVGGSFHLPLFLRGLAHRRIRADEPGRLSQARLPQGT